MKKLIFSFFLSITLFTLYSDSPKLISATTLLYLDRNMNQTFRINCTVSANPITKLKSEWHKLILFDKFISQNNDVLDDAKLDSNDVMYSITENTEQQQQQLNYPFGQQTYQFENEDEMEFIKEKLAYSYLWQTPNLEWWSSTTAAASNTPYASTNNFFSTLTTSTNSLSVAEDDRKPFVNALNSSIHYNQKIISRNNQILIITNDTFTNKPNQQKHNLATASLSIEPPFINDTDYLCLIQSNPTTSSKITDTTETPSLTTNYFNKVVTRLSVRQKRRPLLLNCNSLEIPVLLNHLKEQVVDYWYMRTDIKSQEQLNQINKKLMISKNSQRKNRKSILVAAELDDNTVSLYCTAIRGTLMVQFSWRDVKHGQLLGAISNTFVQPTIESSWRRTLNATASQTFTNSNINNGLNLNNNIASMTTHQPFINQANYTVKLHFNPKLPELITVELKLTKINADHYLTQFQCLVSNELGSDSGIFELRRKSVPEKIEQVRARHLTNNHLIITWLPSFDGGFNQQFIVRYALRNDLERALNEIQTKQFLSNTYHRNQDHSRENLNENEILLVEEQNEERINRQNLKDHYDRESDINSKFSSNSDIQWRTEQQQDKQTTVKYSSYSSNNNNFKKRNSKKRINIQWTAFLLDSNGLLAQIGNERLVLNETQIEFTDLKPSTDYYFSVISKNRLGLAKEHSIPILVRTAKADSNQENNLNLESDQVQSNLQLGENSLGLIEYGLLTNPTANLTALLCIASLIILVSVIIFTIYYLRQRASKLNGSLTSADTTCTNSTQSTTLSPSNTKNHSNTSECDENPIESSNEKQTITNDNKEMSLDNQTKTIVDDHYIMNGNNHDTILANNITYPNNSTFTLLSNNSTTTTNLNSTKSNQNDYLKTKQSYYQPNQLSSTNKITNNQSTNLVYAQLRPSDNSVTSSIIHSKNLLQSNLIQNKSIENNYNYATTTLQNPINSINPIIHQLDNNLLANNLNTYDLNSYSCITNNVKSSKATKSELMQTRINKLNTDYKDKYIPYYLNENLLSTSSFDPDLGWDSNMITDFYSTNPASSLSGKLASSNSLCTPSPSTTITYTSQLPHLISSSFATTISPLDQLTPSASYTCRSLNPLDDSQLKLGIVNSNQNQFISPLLNTNQSSPLLVQTLNKNHSTNHFLTSDFTHHQDNIDVITNYSTLQTSHHSKASIKKSSNKSNHCKVVSFQKPVECWMLDNEKDSYYKQ